jgi:hypothetical protein
LKRKWEVPTANICDLGWKAREFALKGVKRETYSSLADVRARKARSKASIERI